MRELAERLKEAGVKKIGTIAHLDIILCGADAPKARSGKTIPQLLDRSGVPHLLSGAKLTTLPK